MPKYLSTDFRVRGNEGALCILQSLCLEQYSIGQSNLAYVVQSTCQLYIVALVFGPAEFEGKQRSQSSHPSAVASRLFVLDVCCNRKTFQRFDVRFLSAPLRRLRSKIGVNEPELAQIVTFCC